MKIKLSFHLLISFALILFTLSCSKDSPFTLEEETSLKDLIVLNCDSPEDCNGGAELLKLFPEVENYFFDLHVYRTDQSVTVNSVTEFNALSDYQKCHVISYSDEVSAIGNGSPHIQFEFIANLPYHENERYWFIAGLLPNGGQMPTPNDFIRVKLFHPSSGNDCLDLYDGIITNTIKSWDTVDCEDTGQSDNCRHRN